MTAPLTLSYDDLPAGSDIRRDYGPDGRSVRIVVPAGEPPASVVRATAQAAAVSGALLSAAALGGFLAVFVYFVRTNDIAGLALRWAVGFFAIFCTAIVALVAWVRYGMLLEALQAGRRQATVMAITPAGLLIETSGPFGAGGHDIDAERVRDVRVERTWLRDGRGINRRVNVVAIYLTNGRRVRLLPGRDRNELQWVATTMRRLLDLQHSPAGESRQTSRR